MCVMSFSECQLQTWMNTYLQHLPCKHQDRLLLITSRGEEIMHRKVRDSSFSFSFGKTPFCSRVERLFFMWAF